MSFSLSELSIFKAKPVELLRITFSMREWCYTTAEKEIVYDGKTYLPLPMKRGNIQPTGDSTKANLVISVPYDLEAGDLFKARPPSEIVTVTLITTHYGDGEYRVLWKGRITACNWQHPWLELHTESVFSSLKRIGLRRRYSAQCTHVLYEGGCNIAKETYRHTGQATAISGSQVTVGSIPAAVVGYYAGGYAEWQHNGTLATERSMIVSHAASGVLTLTNPPVGLALNATITIYPGCDHLLSTCDAKFGNSLNFGGQPFIPQKNPFNGSTIY